MSKLPQETSLATYTLLLDGSPMKPTFGVQSIRIYKACNKIATAHITLVDGDAASESFLVSSDKSMAPGTEVEIKLGYHSKEKSVYKGILVAQKIKSRRGRPSGLVLTCKDKFVKSTIGRKNRYFLKKKDSDALQTIIGEYGVSKTVDATTVSHKELIQYNCSDWEFICMRAEQNGLLIMVEDGKVRVEKPKLSGSAVLEIGYGDDVYEMEMEMDATTQLAKVDSAGWDYATQKNVEEASTEPSVNKQGNITPKKLSEVSAPSSYLLQHGGDLASDELKAWANAQLLKSRLAKIKGWVLVQGNVVAKLGDLIEIEGVGDRFQGQGLVTGIRHELSEGNWTTHYQLGLEEEWISAPQSATAPPAGGLLAGVGGLQVGVVQKIDADPDGEFRVQVKLPLADEKGDGVWARIARFYASSDVGAFFMPEISDEVILGFIENDPRFPIILGMLHSKKIKAPLTPDKKNPLKVLVTKSKLTLSFDDENKVIELSTPGKNVITISDKDKSITLTDQNKNKVELGSSGITLDSPKNITIKAKGNVSVQAQGNIDAKANANLSLQGLNVSAKANAQFSASGNAGAELKTSAIAQIQGTLVKIN